MNRQLFKQHRWPLCGLLLAWLAYAGPILSPYSNLYLTDMYAMDVPTRIHCAKMIRQGEFPHWTTDVQCGFPLHSDSQAGILYPFFLLYVAWPSPEMNDIFMALHIFLAGLFTYLLLASRGVRPWAALVGGVTFMACGYLQTKHVVPGVLAASVWYPLGVFCVDRYVQGSRQAIWWCALSNATALMAGHVQTMLIAFTLQFAWLFYNLGLRRLPTVFVASCVAFVLPLFLCAAQILPTINFLNNSTRSSGHMASQLELDAFMQYGIEWSHLVQIFLPDYLGTPESFSLPYPPWNYAPWEEALGQFNGYAAIVLVPWGIWNWRRRREVHFWIAAGILGLMLASATPLRAILFYVPIYNLFRWPAVYLLWFTLAVTVLSGAGFDGLLAWLERRNADRPWLVRGLTVACVSLAILGVVHRNFSRYLTPADFYQIHSPELVAEAQRSEHMRLLPVARALYHYWNASESQLRSNARFMPACYNLMFDIPGATLFGQGSTVSPRAITDLIRCRHDNFLKLAAVTHVSSPDPLDDLDPDEVLLIEPVPLPRLVDVEPIATGPAYVYRYLPAMPRAWMVYDATAIESVQQRLDLLCSDEFDPRRTIILEDDVEPCGEPTSEAVVTLRQPRFHELDIEVETSADGYLYVADTFGSEFHATVDGQPVPLLRANHAFRAVHLSAGTHRVVMKMWPSSFYQGLLASCVALAFTLAGLRRARRRDFAMQENRNEPIR